MTKYKPKLITSLKLKCNFIVNYKQPKIEAYDHRTYEKPNVKTYTQRSVIVPHEDTIITKIK